MASPTPSEAWKELTSGKCNWILYGYQGGQLKHIGSGSGGLAEFVSHFNEEGLFFGGLRIDGVDDRENVTSRRDKYAAISFVGEGVKGVVRAQALQLKDQFDRDFFSAHFRAQLTRVEELSAFSLAKTLLACGGAHKPRYYDFLDGQNRINLDELGGQNEKEILKNTGDAAASSGNKATYDGPKMTPHEAFNKVFNSKSEYNWTLLGFPEGSSSLDFLALGSGGFKELKEWFDADRVLFAALKVIANTEKDGVTMKRPLLVSVTFVGSRVKGVKKMKALQCKSDVAAVFSGIHLDVQYTDPDDFEAQALVRDLSNVGGGEKPNSLDFGGGLVLQV